MAPETPPTIGTHVPAPSGEAVSALERAFRDPGHPERLSPAALGALRMQLVRVLNAAVAEDPRNPEGCVARLTGEWKLGISYVLGKKGFPGVREYVSPEQLAKAVAIGRTLKREALHDPIEEIEKRNTIPGVSAPFSAAVAHGFQYADRMLVPVVSDAFRRRMASADRYECEHLAELHQFDKDIATLRGILALADTLHFTHEAARDVPREIHSGFLNVLHVTERRVSYLETAVFCAVFARRHRLRRRSDASPCMLPTSAAKEFARDLDPQGLQIRESSLTAYEEAARETFPDQQETAWLLMRYTLEELTEAARHLRAEIAQRLSPQLFFPVTRFSREALKHLKRIDRTFR